MRDRPLTLYFLASLYSCSRVRPLGPRLPERCPPRWLGDLPRVEVRDRWRDSPERARSFCTVRAAISSALRPPRARWLRLMCSYCRARFVPFLTPRGGIAVSSFLVFYLQACASWTSCCTTELGTG